MIAAICKCVADTMPLIVEQLEAAARVPAVPVSEPTMTHWERLALRNAVASASATS